MPELTVASRLLEQEARALLTRLVRVKPFALNETMVLAAALAPQAQSAIEYYLLDGRRKLRRQVEAYIAWLHGPGKGAPPAELQRKFTVIRLQFNNVLSQFDLFTEVITQRSEHETGVWLSGLDALAADAMALPEVYAAPPAICYLARGPGAAIRRARTRLPGGGENPVAIIRVPRERMVGHGIASSLVHEVGHQVAALLELVPSLTASLAQMQAKAGPREAETWRTWGRWISEIVADLWSVSRVGPGSTLGLMSVVSLPRWFVFRPSGDDPHPTPWVRVRLSCAMGHALYPHPQWRSLAELWKSLYPTDGLPQSQATALQALEASMPAFTELLLTHRPATLKGGALAQVLRLEDRRPERLDATYQIWRRQPALVRQARPTLAFAVLGQARATNRLTAGAESRLLGELLTHWALRSSLDTSLICAGARPRGVTAAQAS